MITGTIRSSAAIASAISLTVAATALAAAAIFVERKLPAHAKSMFMMD